MISLLKSIWALIRKVDDQYKNADEGELARLRSQYETCKIECKQKMQAWGLSFSENVDENRSILLKTQKELHDKEIELCKILQQKGHDETCEREINNLRLSISEIRNFKKADEFEYLKLAILNEEKRISNFHLYNDQLIKRELQTLTNQICAKQPQLSICDLSQFGKAEDSPSGIVIGSCECCFNKGLSLLFPRIIPFPVPWALRLENKERDKNFVLEFILRLFQCVPLNQIEITAIDPISLGQSLPDVKGLLSLKKPFTDQKILTNAAEIQQSLVRTLSYVENLLQKVFLSNDNWVEYNQKNPKNKLPYKLIIVYDAPDQLTPESMHCLERLVESGPRCGVLPLIFMDKDFVTGTTDKRMEHFIQSVNTLPMMSELCQKAKFARGLKATITEINENIPERKRLEIFNVIEEKFNDSIQFKRNIEDLFVKSECWKSDSSRELNACVGWALDGNLPISFVLGDMPTHALLGGTTGSGKSNFLHVLIHSLCYNYSPSELELYLLDYKEGTEFNVYANPLLPHAKLIATESDVEYGITVLEHIDSQIKARASLFKRENVNCINDYRKKGYSLPREILIIDEFQKIFDNKDLSTTANKILENLLRQGRAYGIHVILATQTLKGLSQQTGTGPGMGPLVTNLACRVALKCSPEDSCTLLGSRNEAAAKLTSPPQGIINKELGAPSANEIINIPYAERDVCARIRAKFNEFAENVGYKSNCRIFNGNALPEMPEISYFAEKLCLCKKSELLIGLEHNFEESACYINLDSGDLLVAGQDENLHNSILASCFRSLATRKEENKVLYYNTLGEYGIDSHLIPSYVQHVDRVELNELKQFTETDLDKERFVIINCLDDAGEFIPKAAVLGGKPVTESVGTFLENHLKQRQKRGLHFIVFIKQYKRIIQTSASPGKNLLGNFNLRLLFSLDDSALKELAMTSAAKPFFETNKAILFDAQKFTKQIIRPFALKPKES
jgi:hypothetical protein